MKNIYRVTFVTKKGGEKFYSIDIEANTAKEAKETMKSMWKSDKHAFDITTKKVDEIKYHDFNRIYRVWWSYVDDIHSFETFTTDNEETAKKKVAELKENETVRYCGYA